MSARRCGMRQTGLAVTVFAALAVTAIESWCAPRLTFADSAKTIRPAKAVKAVKEVKAAIKAIRAVGGTVRSVGAGRGHDVSLNVRGREVKDAVLIHVAALGDVVSLNLRDTAVTDAGLARLATLKTLETLHLERTGIGDEGVAHLTGLPRLEYLNLYSTKITDRALVHLEGLGKLERLYVWQTGVTDRGVARLEAARPGLRIVRGVDPSTLPDFEELEQEVLVPKEDLEWIPTGDIADAPRSRNGINTTVIFENKSGKRVKLVWISYGGEPKLYATLEPGARREQNSYASNTWLITDEKDRPLGYFVVGMEVGRAVIPSAEKKE